MLTLCLYFIFTLCSDCGVVIMPVVAVVLLWSNGQRLFILSLNLSWL